MDDQGSEMSSDEDANDENCSDGEDALSDCEAQTGSKGKSIFTTVILAICLKI